MFFGFDFVSWAFGVISEKSWPNSKLQRLSPGSVSAFHLRLVRDGLEKTSLWVCGGPRSRHTCRRVCSSTVHAVTRARRACREPGRGRALSHASRCVDARPRSLHGPSSGSVRGALGPSVWAWRRGAPLPASPCGTSPRRGMGSPAAATPPRTVHWPLSPRAFVPTRRPADA